MNPRYVLKRELLADPCLDVVGQRLPNHFLDRQATDSTPELLALEELVTGIDESTVGIIFPEGTRVEPGVKSKYARGGTNIAIKAGAPIVPIALNAGAFWPADKFLKRPGTVTVVIGEPIDSRGRDSRELTEQVEAWIENEVSKLPS